MPSIVGKYLHYKNENMDEYFAVTDEPLVARKIWTLYSPLLEITLDDEENMRIKNVNIIRTVVNTIKLGVEYEEPLSGAWVKSVTRIVNDNELITESVISGSGVKCGRHYVFSDDECVITFTHEEATPGKKYYKRLP